MQLVHTQLTKTQRSLRAILNTTEVPAGFKGNPLISKLDRLPEERSLSPANMSRYAYVRGLLECEILRLCWIVGNDREFNIRGVKAKISRRTLIESKRNFLEIKKYRDMENEYVEMLKAYQQLDSKMVKRVNRMFKQVVLYLISNRSGIAAQNLSEGNDAIFIRDIREWGRDSITLKYLHSYASFYKEGAKTLTELDRVALDILTLHLISEAMMRGSRTSIEQENGTCGKLGRAKFSRGHEQAWRYVRKHLFDGLTEQMVFDAVHMNGWTRINQIYLSRLMDIHHAFAYSEELGIHGKRFRVEGSPFAEKRIGEPIGNFDIVVYPTTEQMKCALLTVTDPTFEHANGSLAFAAITIKDKTLILEEIQTDVPDLFRRLRLTNLAVRRREAIDRAEETLAPFMEKWPEIILESVRSFARRNSYLEFYAGTPWRVMRRYNGTMHPDKATKVYLDLMQKLGGQLVYDETQLLDRTPQYYWRFTTNPQTNEEIRRR